MSSASITKHDIGKLKLIWDDPIHPCNCLVVFKALHGFVKEILLFFSFELYSGSTQSIANILSLLSVTLKHDCCIRISILTPKGKSLKPWHLARTWFLARYRLNSTGSSVSHLCALYKFPHFLKKTHTFIPKNSSWLHNSSCR